MESSHRVCHEQVEKCPVHLAEVFLSLPFSSYKAPSAIILRSTVEPVTLYGSEIWGVRFPAGALAGDGSLNWLKNLTNLI